MTAGDDDELGAPEALHDVSNALTVVLGWLEEATRTGDEAGRAHALEIATRKAREARALARRAIGGAPEDDPTQPIGTVVSELLDALAFELERRALKIALRGGELPVRVRRGTSVTHVLTNLLLNAIAYAPHGSTVHVTVAQSGPGVTIEVVDEGPGIDPGMRPRLFEGATAREGGAGIGLRHSREVARALGGELAHVPTDRGGAFVLTLPRADSPAPIDRPSASRQPVVVAGARVLVVEDDRAVCALLDAGLGARGVEVVSLHDGATLARQLPTLGRFDAVLLDLSPIAEDVAGALAAVKRALPDAGIVFISGSAIALDAELGAAGSNARWVRKPFELAEIAEALAALMPARR